MIRRTTAVLLCALFVGWLVGVPLALPYPGPPAMAAQDGVAGMVAMDVPTTPDPRIEAPIQPGRLDAPAPTLLANWPDESRPHASGVSVPPVPLFVRLQSLLI